MAETPKDEAAIVEEIMHGGGRADPSPGELRDDDERMDAIARERQAAREAASPGAFAPDDSLADRLKCEGKFGFGDGYTMVDGLAYCSVCPLGERCWDQTKSGLEITHGDQVERYQRLIAEVALKHRVSRDRAAAWASAKLLEFGTPDPYNAARFRNMDAGMALRQQHDPSVLKRKIGRPA